MIWAYPRDVILYARSSYYHKNMFIKNSFLTFFSDFINCFGLVFNLEKVREHSPLRYVS